MTDMGVLHMVGAAVVLATFLGLMANRKKWSPELEFLARRASRWLRHPRR